LELAIALVAILVAGLAAIIWRRNRRTAGLRTRFGEAEYARALDEGGNRRHAEAALDERAQRIEALHIRPLAANDRARFVATWREVQSRFVDGPAGAVTAADQLLGDVMSTRGYPIGNYDQRAADISVDHPLVLENYRTAHEIALRETRGQAGTEDLRQAMVHFRTLFEELVNEPGLPLAKAASQANWAGRFACPGTLATSHAWASKGTAMSFGIYIVGFLILIGGLIYGAVILHVAPHWIAVGAIVLVGLAIVKGVQATRGKDPAH
jgi:hypothetical protein